MKKERNPFFDNAKYLLIILVVIGHAIEPYLKDYSALSAIYKSIYLFHMPAFAIICGYFAKGYNPEKDLSRIAKKALFPYFVAEIILDIFTTYPTIRLTPLTPSWGMWFLLSYFSWYLLLPLYMKFKKPIISSLVVGILIGYFTDIDSFLSLSRTIVLMPFFISGYFFDKKTFKIEKKYLGLLFIPCFLVLILINLKLDYDYRILHNSLPFYNLRIFDFGWLYRGTIYAGAYMLSILFFSLIPSKKTFFTKFGSNTINAYLFQILFFSILLRNRANEYLNTPKEICLLTAAAVILTTLFSTDSFANFWKKICIRLRIDYIKKSVRKN